jgi:hypothetical protein
MKMNTTKEAMVPCNSCDGYGYDGVDEEGKPYTCYRCAQTGWITRASAEQEARDEAAAAAEHEIAIAQRRKDLGVPDGYGYYIDEVDGEVVLIPPRRAGPPAPVCYDDDIPF